MGGDSLSFLPTIKCSDCGADIEISQLADHVCALVPLSKNSSEALEMLRLTDHPRSRGAFLTEAGTRTYFRQRIFQQQARQQSFPNRADATTTTDRPSCC